MGMGFERAHMRHEKMCQTRRRWLTWWGALHPARTSQLRYHVSQAVFELNVCHNKEDTKQANTSQESCSTRSLVGKKSISAPVVGWVATIGIVDEMLFMKC